MLDSSNIHKTNFYYMRYIADTGARLAFKREMVVQGDWGSKRGWLKEE